MAGLVLAAGLDVQAGARSFAYNYETTVMPKGVWEYEQHLNWKTHKHDTDSSFDRLDIRHEIEYGLTDRLQTALYFDWRYQDGESVERDRARFRDVAWETIYQLTDPDQEAFGSALYGEVKLGDEIIETEGKLLLQKNIGDWALVWNGSVAAKWESKGYDEKKGEVGQTVGASYRLCDRLSLGVEAVHELEIGNWEQAGRNVVYAGPSLSVQALGGYFTVSQLAQVSDVQDEADYQTRLIAAFLF
ncbi:MAG: hypothetical protein HOO88_01655 [Kiritimatiellaceae bacterium]|nr:hypothetical protein [Kiritimatiellaceae bacterium]